MEVEEGHNKGWDFGGGNIPELFRILFFPTLAAMVFEALFVIVDGIFIGHGSGPSGIAAISIFFALNIAFIGYYQAIKKSARATAYTLLRGMVFIVPCLLFLPDIIGIPGLWLAIPVSGMLTFLVIITGFRQTANERM